ncbi:MAG TPA: hypothetical protein VFU31_15190, partial [Candidatus Binatia bacterium]|nr:hypothetical protein [Candidatus Binatia bacterium]
TKEHMEGESSAVFSQEGKGVSPRSREGEVSLQDFNPSLEKEGKGRFLGGVREGIMWRISGSGH